MEIIAFHSNPDNQICSSDHILEGIFLACNICNSTKFSTWRGRANEQCDGCGGLARHRVAMAVYKHRILEPDLQNLRVLHLAPERCLHPVLLQNIGAGYICADASPNDYPHAQCLKLYFPDDFELFPDNYFDAILHNHVLEHIPGHYGDHLLAFARMVKPGGQMIMSVPGPYMDMKTIEGGENLATDQERLEQFLQEDHYKLLGTDFVEFLANLKGGKLLPDPVSEEQRAALNVRPKKAPMFIWRKFD